MQSFQIVARPLASKQYNGHPLPPLQSLASGKHVALTPSPTRCPAPPAPSPSARGALAAGGLALAPGCIYVWEERSSNPLEATGQEIQRFTEGRSWGPSRARDNFLIYYEKDSPARNSLLHRKNIRHAPQFIKQTYSVYVDYPRNSKKWHLNAYYTQESLEALATVDDVSIFKSIKVPPNQYSPDIVAADPSPPPSSSSSDGSEAHCRASPPISIPPSSPVVPAAPLPPGRSVADCCLAPLAYLQNISPRARDPLDDEVLRQFHLDMSLV
ncbi:hypothetical protein NUW54_g7118 [Trametes sanguinea]|uniref:Uncharacterized protein n=1 Tax=Trametes sanguinea TaxID=158606 RepID=A0ACC1PQL1_9APHY|nr:hypothetical protein NUW54_g7118 [Trametes sanguinea]